jgi:hypothetical protein
VPYFSHKIRKKTLPTFSFISENQQGFSVIEVFCYSVSNTRNVAKSLPALKQICLKRA